MTSSATCVRRCAASEPRTSRSRSARATRRRERAAMARRPPDILVTTPESLYLILTSQAREMLGAVHTVIVDEIHAVAASKRGAHLALTLERLEALVRASAGGEIPAER